MRRIGQNDLDQLLDLVEKNRNDGLRSDGSYTLDTHVSGPLWSRNQDYWVEQLRQETSSSWSDEQYIDAAKLINFAEYQRTALKDFVHVLVGSEELDDDADEQPADTTDQIVLLNGYAAPGSDGQAEIGLPAALNMQSGQQFDLQNCEAGRPDLSALSAVRGRDSGATQLNQIRADLYVQTGLSSLRPYASWDDFQLRNALPETLVADLKSAYPEGIDAVDIWVGGLAEVAGLALETSTLKVAISTETGRLHQTAATLGLFELSGNSLIANANSVAFDDIVQRHTNFEDAQAINGAQPTDLATLSRNALSGQTLTGTDADDVVIGGKYDDQIFGGAGDDLLLGGAGHDVIQAGSGDDTVHGNSGADKISGNAGKDRLFGDSGDDVIKGDDDDDFIRGDEGRDAIYGGSGRDNLSGGTGDDDISGDAGDDEIKGDQGDDKVSGGTGDDRISGGTGDDELSGDAGDDVIMGDEGDDALDGGEGADIMLGGLGDDTIYINDQGDQAIEGASEGTDTVGTTLNAYVLPENVEILIFIGHGDFEGTGNDQDNTIIGGDGNDTLRGGAGDDTLGGGAGTNVLIGGLGNDLIIVSNSGDIVIEQFGQGTDTVTTTLNGYDLGENVEILIFTGTGDFTGSGNDLDNIITGGGWDDMLSGGAGADTLYGGDGNDNLDGGDGDDFVYGGQGSDFVMFTRGSDTLVLRPGFGNDVVIGFDTSSSGPGGHDRLDVSAYGFNADSLGVDILLIYDGEATTITIGADSVKLLLVDIKTLDRNDFIFS